MTNFAFKYFDKWINVMLDCRRSTEKMSDSKKKVRLYKCIGKDYILSTIQEGTVKLSRLGASNDPIEFRPQGHDYRLNRWHEYIQSIRPLVLCLSSKYSSSPMWAHYANNHQGAAVAFEFDIQKSFKIPLPNKYGLKGAFLYMHEINEKWYLMKCVYSKKRVAIPVSIREVNKIRRKYDRNQNKVMNDMCFLVFQMAILKGTEWAYENEYRLVYMGDHSALEISANSIVDRFKDNIRGILIGYDNKEEKMIKEMADEYRPDIWIRKMDCSSSEFDMRCEKLPTGTKKLERLEENAEEIKSIEIIKTILKGRMPSFTHRGLEYYLH